MVNINKYIKALLHQTGGHQRSHKAHQAGNQSKRAMYKSAYVDFVMVKTFLAGWVGVGAVSGLVGGWDWLGGCGYKVLLTSQTLSWYKHIIKGVAVGGWVWVCVRGWGGMGIIFCVRKCWHDIKITIKGLWWRGRVCVRGLGGGREQIAPRRIPYRLNYCHLWVKVVVFAVFKIITCDHDELKYHSPIFIWIIISGQVYFIHDIWCINVSWIFHGPLFLTRINFNPSMDK